MPVSPKLAIILLAAGQSRRMGEDKLLKRLPSGKPLLEDRLEMVAETGWPVFVALPQAASARRALVAAHEVRPVICPDGESGIGDSLSHAVRALPHSLDGALVMLSDLPALTSDNLLALSNRFDGKQVVRATTPDGKPGHPVLFPSRLFAILGELSGDLGARDVLGQEDIVSVPLSDDRAIRDLDTEADWREWLSRSGKHQGST